MEKISDGYYCDVFDLKNGIVLKKKKSFKNIFKSIKGKTSKSFFTDLFNTWKHIHDCERTTKIVLQNKHIPLELLGNPRFLNKTDYEQDKVILLMDYFDSHSLEENKYIVDAYFDLIKELFGYEVHDNVYKFKNSYGINQKGQVVCIDFNEMVFSKKTVLTLAANEEWRTQAQFTKFKEGPLKDYLASKFREVLNKSVIEKLWDTR